MAALFGWQGISLRHPDDWAPVALTGDRKSGYARLASPRGQSLHVRWAPRGSESLERALERYLDRLSRDARRKKLAFTRESEAGEAGVSYRYRGEVDGEGLLFPTVDGRVAFLEAVGESGSARRRLVTQASSSFRTDEERWCLLGLDVRLPGPLRVEKKEFFAGRTALTLVGHGVRVTAERWGLAENLLARQSLPEWVHGRLGRGWSVDEKPVARSVEDAEDAEIPDRRASEAIVLGGALRSPHSSQRDSLHASRTPYLFTGGFEDALVRHQPNKNQIVLLRVRSRKPEWRPQWDWLT